MKRDANTELYRILLMFGICLLHRHVPVCGRWAQIVRFLAPSMFPVYLLRATPLGMRHVIPTGVTSLMEFGFNKWIAYFAVAAGIFMGAVALDMFRRLGFLLILRMGGQRND